MPAPSSAPAPVSVVGAGATARLTRLHPSATESCVECWSPIGAHEPVRAVVTGPVHSGRLLGFVHVLACSDRVREKCDSFAEYVAINARLVDLG